MDRNAFQSRLQMATREAVEFARQHVLQQLPDEVVFRVYPNQSYDEHPRVGDEVVFPGESFDQGTYHGPWSAPEVVAWLWRESKVPEWIDVSVEAADGANTVVGLRCCGRFTATEELLYYPGLATRPFAVKSPVLPPGWKGSEAPARFDLNWREATFWSSVTWPRGEGGLVLVVGPLAFFIGGLIYGGWTYGFVSAGVMLPVLCVGWALHRVLKAWAEWPTRHRGVAWLKSAVRYFLTDS